MEAIAACSSGIMLSLGGGMMIGSMLTILCLVLLDMLKIKKAPVGK